MPYKPNPEARGVSRKTDGEGPGAEDHVMEGQHRVIDRWQRGDEGPNGWTESLIVRVRSEDVNPILEDTQSEPGSTTEVVHGSGSEHANVLLTWENTASDSHFSSRQKDIHAMRVSHSFPAISATFDDPNLVSCAGLAPTMALAQRAGLTDLVSSTLTLKAVGGVNAH